MPVQSRKYGAAAVATGGRVVQLARCGGRSAATWAAPRVYGARAWAAPRIERGGLAITDTIAPKISEVFVVTARRVDVPRPRPRWPRVMAGTALLAAAGAAAAVVLRRRAQDAARGAPAEAAGEGTSPEAAQDGAARAGADGSGAGEDTNRSSPAP